MRATTKLRALLAEREFTVTATAYDPLSGLLLQEAGFPLSYIGGYVVGSQLTCGEPLLTATEMIDASQRIAAALTIPTIADAGAGFGNLPHTRRTVRGFERAGVAGIHIEDQVVPKRAGYHRGEVHIVQRDEMERKLRTALDARTDDDFVIIARTDARKAVNGGFDEALARLEMFADCGADLLLAFPASTQEAEAFSRVAPGKLVYVAPEGRDARPNLPAATLRDMGCKMLVYSEGALLRATRTVREYFNELRQASDSNEEDERFLAAERAAVEETLNLTELYALEDLETL